MTKKELLALADKYQELTEELKYAADGLPSPIILRPSDRIAKWLGPQDDAFECSNCSFFFGCRTPYCPYCGALMGGADD